MELIKKWLTGTRNFHIGVVLYNQFGTDARLKKYFEGQPDPVKQKKLETELSELLQKPKVVPIAPKMIGELDIMLPDDDPVLESLRAEWNPLYQRMNYLRHELDRFQGNSPESIAARKPLAFEILRIEQSCMKIWARRDYYVDYGRLPEVDPINEPLPEDPVELGKMIETLKRNIRRNTKPLNDNPGNTRYALKIKNYQARLDEILQKTKDGK